MSLSFKRDEKLNSKTMKFVTIKPGVDQELGGLKRVNEVTNFFLD